MVFLPFSKNLYETLKSQLAISISKVRVQLVSIKAHTSGSSRYPCSVEIILILYLAILSLL